MLTTETQRSLDYISEGSVSHINGPVFLLEQLYMQARSKQWWYGHVTMGMEYHHSYSVGYMQPAFCVAVCELLSIFKNYRILPKCGTATVVPAMQVAMGLR